MVGSGGFEPPKPKHLVYSQAQLSTLATARCHALAKKNAPGADDGTRTRNRLFTKQLLCQLSYVGIVGGRRFNANQKYTKAGTFGQPNIVWALRMSRWHVWKNRHRRMGVVVPGAGRFRENERSVHFSPDDDWRGEMIRADRRAILE